MKIKSMDRMFLPVGQGAFYCERFYNAEQGNNLNVVYDCGTITGRTDKARLELIREVVDRNFQDANDKIIDAVFISHLHEDHFNGLEYLVKKCKIQRIYLPQTNPLELKLMQLYYVAHHTAWAMGGRIGSNSLGEHFLECNDLEKDFPEALRSILQDDDDDQRADDRNNGDMPVVLQVGQKPIVVSNAIFEGTELEGKFTNWKYKTFCIKNDEAIQRVEDGLKQLIHDKLKRDINAVTPSHVAELIENCRADKTFRREIRRMFKSAIDDFHANSLVLYSGCDNTAGLYAHSVELPCALLRDRSCKFLKNITNQSTCWMFTNAVGCLYTGDFDAKTKKYWRQLKGGFKTEWVTIGCVQIPHHGSKMNYNNEFLAMTPWHVVSARENSKKHPHQEVRAKYKDRCPLFVVTENMNSFAKWCIEEKSSIHRAMFDTVFHGATWMEWYKESGTSVSLKIQEHDEIPLKWGAEREERESQPPLVE